MAELRAWIGGQWVTVGAPAPVVPDEVFVGPDDPYLTDPAGTWEVWISPPKFVAFLVSECPANPHAGVEVVKTRLGGFTPGNSYTAKVTNESGGDFGFLDTATGAATQVAGADGELLWGWKQTSNTNQSPSTPSTFSVHDGAANTAPECYSETKQFLLVSAVVVTPPFPWTVGVPGTLQWGGDGRLVPGEQLELTVVNGPFNVTITEPMLQTVAADGTVRWTVTWNQTVNGGQIRAQTVPAPGSPCTYVFLHQIASCVVN